MNLVTSLLNGVTFGALLFLVSSGFTIIFGFMRVLNLAHGAFYMWGGLTGAVVYDRTGSFVLGLVGGALAVGVFGWIADITLFRRVRLMPVREVLLTLGLGMVMGDLALAVFGGDPKRISVPDLLGGSVALGGITFPKYRLVLLVLAIAVYALLHFLVVRTRVGATIRAGVDDSEMLEATGTNFTRLGTMVFAAGSALIGATGLLGAGFLGSYPGVDTDILILAVVVVIVGGLGSLVGAALGSVAVGLLFSFGSAYLPSLLYFVIFAPVIVFLYFRPHGIKGLPE